MIYLLIATICFSFSFGLIKSQVSSLPVNIVVFWRLLIASLIFLPIFLVNLKKINFLQIRNALFIGILQFGLMYICFLRAFNYLQGNEIVLLTASTPIFVIIVSSIFSKNFNWKFLLCALLAVFGAIIVALGTTTPSMLLKGVIYMELSNITFALGQILWQKYVFEQAEKLMFPAYFAAACFVLPFAYLNNFATFNPTNLQWLSIFYLAIVPTGIGFWLWAKGLQQVSGVMLAVMNNLKIPFGVLFALLIFNEKTNIPNFIIGFSLILLAIIYSYFLDKKD